MKFLRKNQNYKKTVLNNYSSVSKLEFKQLKLAQKTRILLLYSLKKYFINSYKRKNRVKYC